MIQSISKVFMVIFLCLHMGNSFGNGIQILIVDAGQSECGDYCAKLVTDYYGKQSLTHIDISSLAEVTPQNWNAVIIIRPDIANNSTKVNKALKRIISNPKMGLLIFGLPVDKKGQDALLNFLGDRSPASIGNHFEYDFEHCEWIWASDGPRDKDTIYFRKKFNVNGETAKAAMMLTVDNSAMIWINGQFLGETNSWTDPVNYDITRLAKPGENTVCVKAYNGDGLAGLIVSLNVYDKNGKTIGQANTDDTWKCSRTKYINWNKTTFNDSKWGNAKQIGGIDAKPWSGRVNHDFRINEQNIYIPDSVHTSSLGLMVILDSLVPGHGAKILLEGECGNIAVANKNVNGQKNILISGYPELTSSRNSSCCILESDRFNNFMIDSLIWLTGDNSEIKLGEINLPPKAKVGENLKISLPIWAKKSGRFKISCLVSGKATKSEEQLQFLTVPVNVNFDIKLNEKFFNEESPDICIKLWDEKKRLVAGKTQHLKICNPVNLSLSLNTSRTIFKNTETLEMDISAVTISPDVAIGNVIIEILPTGAKQGIFSKKNEAVNSSQFNIKSALNLSQFKPGKYDIKMTVKDKTGKILGFFSRQISIARPLTTADGFPIAVQYGKIPCAVQTSTNNLIAGRQDQSVTDIDKSLANIRDHGFTCLYIDSYIGPDKTAKLTDRAQSLGMMISYSIDDPIEQFNRDLPPDVCVYSPRYAQVVSGKARNYVSQLNSIPRLLNVFMYQDEPFHWGGKSFGYNTEVREEFLHRYGYKLPEDLKTIYDKPQEWLDVINFRSDYFRDGWRQSYKCVKDMLPNLDMVVTHDSHNTFGAGTPPYTEIAMDDVYHWSGDWADTFVFDIYPYMGIDFRYGENLSVPKPRMSQVHFALGQMRNLARTYGKKMGFWFGTYNSAWFNLTQERKEQYWSEREMCYTAIANDADFLISGYGIPEDIKHWETLGQGLKTIQKVGPELLKTRKLKSKVAFLFPRTQYIQLQEEYWNVAQSFELFLRSFGELDVIHEEQIVDETLNGYKVLVMCDIKLLPGKTAEHIVDFVKNGGILISDCVPTLNQYKQPMEIMKKLFGVTQSSFCRIISSEGYKSFYPEQAEREKLQIKDTKKNYALVSGQINAADFRIKVVSPRPAKGVDGEVLLNMQNYGPGLIKKKYGMGSIYLVCFCLQDTYFETWKQKNPIERAKLRHMLSYLFEDAGVVSHVYSSNPDIEVSVRANANRGYLFVVSHEAPENSTIVTLTELPFKLKLVMDVENGNEVTFRCDGATYILEVAVGDGKTSLFELLSK